jgi:hypothetical protein
MRPRQRRLPPKQPGVEARVIFPSIVLGVVYSVVALAGHLGDTYGAYQFTVVPFIPFVRFGHRRMALTFDDLRARRGAGVTTRRALRCSRLHLIGSDAAQHQVDIVRVEPDDTAAGKPIRRDYPGADPASDRAGLTPRRAANSARPIISRAGARFLLVVNAGGHGDLPGTDFSAPVLRVLVEIVLPGVGPHRVARADLAWSQFTPRCQEVQVGTSMLPGPQLDPGTVSSCSAAGSRARSRGRYLLGFSASSDVVDTQPGADRRAPRVPAPVDEHVRPGPPDRQALDVFRRPAPRRPRRRPGWVVQFRCGAGPAGR